MSVLIQNSNVLKSISGEVFDKPDALIDIRSTYGVTKDGSNIVQRIKYRNNPSIRFHSPINNPCIVNGNGFDFSSNVNGYLQTKNFTGISNGFSISFWCKFNIVPTAVTMLLSFDTASSRGWALYFDAIAGLLKLSVYNGLPSGNYYAAYENNPITVTYTDWNYYTVEKHANGDYIFYRNGVSSYREYPYNTNPLISNNKGILGATLNGGGYFKGFLEDLVIYPFPIYNKFRIANGTTVFTPPIRSSSL